VSEVSAYSTSDYVTLAGIFFFNKYLASALHYLPSYNYGEMPPASSVHCLDDLLRFNLVLI
jgi:hypothetical protein